MQGPSAVLARDKHLTVPLWPSQPPGEKGDLGEEKDMTKPTDNKIDGAVLTLVDLEGRKDSDAGKTRKGGKQIFSHK